MVGFGEQDDVGCNDVEDGVRESDEFKEVKGSQALDRVGKEDDGREHGVGALCHEDKADIFSVHIKAAKKFERQIDHSLFMFGAGKKYWEQLVKGNGVAVMVSLGRSGDDGIVNLLS